MVHTAASFGDLEREFLAANVDLLSKIKQGQQPMEYACSSPPPPPAAPLDHPVVSTSDNENEEDDDDDGMMPFTEIEDHDMQDDNLEEASLFSDIAQDDYQFGLVEEELLQTLLEDTKGDDQLMDQLLTEEHQQQEQEQTQQSPQTVTATPAATEASSSSATISSLSTDMSASWGEYDVPLGRCQEVREFIGNVRFRALIDQHRHAYHSAERKAEKTHLSTVIYNMIHSQGGRFLDKKKTGNPRVIEWEEIPMDKALAKISQTLRNGTRPVRKHIPLPPTTPAAASYSVVSKSGFFGYHSYASTAVPTYCQHYTMTPSTQHQTDATAAIVTNQR